ncbi:MAG TPA: cell division protein FtsH, partial [Dehalococcoidia bacterium]|nr:cell division protein FtsH [Dehalococcoidia bacterium]
TRFLPAEDRHLGTRRQFRAMLASMLGGKTAEELVFGEMTTGASDDISRATKLARQMVTQYGMSERLGPRTFGRKEELVFLGREISEQRDYSEKVAEEIDEEVASIIDEAHQTARRALEENRGKLDRIAEVLIEVETIEGEPLQRLFRGEDPFPGKARDEQPKAPEEPEEQEEAGSEGRDRPKPAAQPGLAWGGGPATIRLEKPDDAVGPN